MRLTVRALGFSLTPALRDHATGAAHTALRRFAARLGRVQVRLSDVNGPRGGVDKRCHVDVVVTGLRQITVEELHADLYAAIDLAVGRAAQSLRRVLDREQRSPKRIGPEAAAGWGLPGRAATRASARARRRRELAPRPRAPGPG